MAIETFLPVAEPDLSELEERYVMEAVRSGWVSSMGPFIDRFEAAFAKFCGTKHAVSVSNGTTALHVTLAAAEIGPGDEVIVPDLTFVATAAAVKHAGADPVLVDIDPETYCIDPELVERAISSKTKAIIPVHLFGYPADMKALGDIAKKHDLFLLEDAAEAHGAMSNGKTVGGIGHAGTFSFYGNKLLTTGEGGVVTTNDDALAARIRFLKDHAMDKSRRYYHPAVGFNYRMTNLQAALGVAQLERFESMQARKAQILSWYRQAFASLSIALNPISTNVDDKSVCWLVAGVLPEGTTNEQRDALATELKKNNVDTRPFFVPMHALPPYEGCRSILNDTPSSTQIGARGLCFPSSNRLSESVVNAIGEIVSTLT